MKSLWNNSEASKFVGDLAQRVYTSRLLGTDGSLVLHGGGNTSVKIRQKDIFGDEEDVLVVKGRGRDLATIDETGFSPCRLRHLLRLTELKSLSDEQMERELRLSMTSSTAPAPSVEALLHAILPAKFVDHTHSDAVLTVTNTPGADGRIREIYGDRLVVIPYAMPGFKLVRLCAQLFPKHASTNTLGMLLMNHGLFAFGDTAKQAYERMIELVTLAEEYLARHGAWPSFLRKQEPSAKTAGGTNHSRESGNSVNNQRLEIAALRKAVSAAAGGPIFLSVHDDPDALAFARRPDVADIATQGPATPDHVIRTKRIPMIGRDVCAYAKAYREYFTEFGSAVLKMLDPAPRVILDPHLGMCAVGRTANDAAIAEDIYRHTMHMIANAITLGGWRALSPRDIFEVEYWDLEQAKLRKGGAPPVFAGEVALVTGAASGIGKACAESLLARGAAVIALDVAPAITQTFKRKDYLGIQCDLTNEVHISDALEQGVRTFGGLDMLVLNAGIFPKSAPVAALSTEVWRKTMSINLDANLVLLRECHPLLKLSPRGGRVVIIGSKNVPAPGPGAAAYSASKAAVQQLARVTALEWGADRIRVNTLHPNAVFDTAIWTPEVLATRAASYKLSVEEYKTNNILKCEVTSRDVAELAAELCGPIFSRTTGAQIPVDGGNERVI
jgi:rhamnose utilization protein RhaD (predicted bifunctional aldolase and dehydrogenase)/NAD(P)-dependent dehydrogenase (short-subunit alcohol dehydrogenase family)